MNKVAACIACVLCIFVPACTGGDRYWYPTYPDNNNYDHNKPYDYGYGNNPDLSRDITGEWEGFLFESHRSDNLPLSKKMVAMRCTYSETRWQGSTRYERVKVDLLIDGRPAALKTVDVWDAGHVWFDSYNNEIDVELDAWFDGDQADGWIDLAWDEKVKLPHSDKVEKHYVELDGDLELDRVKDSHWGEAWNLFDTYGEGVFDLDQSVWETASAAGLAYLATVAENSTTMPLDSSGSSR